MKTHRIVSVMAAAFFAFAVTSANALTDAQVASVKKAFNQVRVTELAPTAAKMVAQAPKAEREAIAVLVTSTVVGQHPAVAVAVVSAIAAVAPETAPAVAATAAKLVEAYAEAIAVAAAKAAPAYAEKVAQAIGTAVPSASAKVMARVRSVGKSAITASGAGSIRIVPGVIKGLTYTPPTPPSPPAVPPVVGYDPKRYSAP
jgi:hypothetical protein